MYSYICMYVNLKQFLQSLPNSLVATDPHLHEAPEPAPTTQISVATDSSSASTAEAGPLITRS
jgi:hypothetical protein